MAIEKLPIRKVTRSSTGYTIKAGEHTFEVSTGGDSAECVPWDAALEKQHQPKPQAPTAAQVWGAAARRVVDESHAKAAARTNRFSPHPVIAALEGVRRDHEIRRQAQADADRDEAARQEKVIHDDRR